MEPRQHANWAGSGNSAPRHGAPLTAAYVPGAAEAYHISLQQRFWNSWNASKRERSIGRISKDQKEVILSWLDRLERTDLNIIEIGCGAGWLCPALKQFGCVTATDLSDEVLARARVRVPQVHFIAGDFMSLPFELNAYDVVVAVEVLAHVADQPGFVAKAATLLRPGGLFMLATQNRPVLERFNSRPPPSPGQLRHWVDRHELHALLAPHFDIMELFSLTPQANRGIMRVVNSHALNLPIRVVAGSSVERLKEKMWLGWTLMALSRKLP